MVVVLPSDLVADRLYLDFDSFFATAEQYFNPALRGRPLGVIPLDSPHTGCIAISREAKRLGVKSSASIKEARAIVPDMIFAVARPDVYVRLHNRILASIETVVPVAHVRSIDEVVCHLMPSEARDGLALARRIKRALSNDFSPVLTCSIGVAPTELLAKIAAECDKPDGCIQIDIANLPDQLGEYKLGKLPGISDGMEARLKRANVHNFHDLWNLAPKQARSIWGSVEGERFWSELHGFPAPRAPTVKRMFGHSRMLPRDWRTPERVSDCARQLTAGAARRLRRTDLRASKLTLSFRSERMSSTRAKNAVAQRWNWEGSFLPARDDYTFMKSLGQGLGQAAQALAFSPRSVSIMLHGLQTDDAITGDLFSALEEDGGQGGDGNLQQKWECVSDTMDQLRAKFGSKALSLGPQQHVPGGYLGGKIAFGRIPDAADFEGEPSADNATHFCSF